jgi:hypothetical protein
VPAERWTGVGCGGGYGSGCAEVVWVDTAFRLLDLGGVRAVLDGPPPAAAALAACAGCTRACRAAGAAAGGAGWCDGACRGACEVSCETSCLKPIGNALEQTSRVQARPPPLSY